MNTTSKLRQIASDNKHAFLLPIDFDLLKIKVPNKQGSIAVELDGNDGELYITVKSDTDDTLLVDTIKTSAVSGKPHDVAELFQFDVSGDNDPITTVLNDGQIDHYVLSDNTVSILYGDETLVISQDELGLKVNDDVVLFDRKNTLHDVNHYLPELRKFMPDNQLAVAAKNLRGEEGQFFKDTLIDIGKTIKNMAKTYEQDGMGDDAIASLHYFRGGMDWYITEKDSEDEQLQAFGIVDLGHGLEMGNVSISELKQNNIELDFHFKPMTVGDIKVKHEDSQSPR